MSSSLTDGETQMHAQLIWRKPCRMSRLSINQIDRIVQRAVCGVRVRFPQAEKVTPTLRSPHEVGLYFVDVVDKV